MSASEIVDAGVLFGTLILGLLAVGLVVLAAVFLTGSVLSIPYALVALLARAVRRAREARQAQREQEPVAETTEGPTPSVRPSTRHRRPPRPLPH
jgi:predicted lipid-binding transport protein (Tim44 family)